MTTYMNVPLTLTEAVGTTGLPVSMGGTGSTVQNYPKWTKYSVAHTALQAAALINNIEIASLPAGSVVHGVVMKTTTAFAGTTTYTLSVGITGSLLKYVAATDVKVAVAGTTFTLPGASFVPGPEDFGAAVSIRLSAISTIQNLDQSSAGAVDIYILTSVLP